jgi:ornithine cyclodeaminase/alanine dehydrogenase-like protein (mu-crystallin family)
MRAVIEPSRPGAARPLVLDAAEVSGHLSMAEAIAELAAHFRDPGFAAGPLRHHFDLSDGSLLLMPAEARAGVGVKLVTTGRRSRESGLPSLQSVYVLFSPATLEPEAMLDGGALTALRTAAVSAVATDRLARADARRLVIFGSGVQARAHLEAMRAVRPIEEVTIVSRNRATAAALVELASASDLKARVGEGAGGLAGSQIVCACTTSSTPLPALTDLPDGAHVNAVGSFQPTDRELPGELMARALVVVDGRAAAMAEAGDVVMAIDEGRLRTEDVGELSEVVRGRLARTHDDQVTVFKAVGLAAADLALARVIVDRAADGSPARRANDERRERRDSNPRPPA